MRPVPSLLLLLLAAVPAWADPPKAVIAGKAAYPSDAPVVLDGSASVSEPGLRLKWVVTPKVPLVTLKADDDTRPAVYALLPKVPDGKYRAKLVVVGKPDPNKPDLDADADVLDFVVGGATPPPQPGPGPGPNPPGPVNPAPIPGAGLRVLVVYEAGDLTKLPAAQQGAIYAKAVRDYLNAACPAGPDGKTREWRMWDKDADASGESKLWRDALARPRTALPWVVVSNGTAGYEGPLPADADAMLQLLKKYGEGK